MTKRFVGFLLLVTIQVISPAEASTKQHIPCKIKKCPAIENPICVKIKSENATKHNMYVQMVNKCEMEYLKCHPGTHAIVVPLKYCDHTPKPEMTEASFRKKRSLLITQQDLSEEDTHNDKNEKKFHNQEALSEVLKSVIKNTKVKLANKNKINKQSHKLKKNVETEESESQSIENKPVKIMRPDRTRQMIIHNKDLRTNKDILMKVPIQRIIHKDIEITTKAFKTTTGTNKRTTTPLKPIPGVARGRVVHNAKERKPSPFDKPYRGAVIKGHRHIARKYDPDSVQHIGISNNNNANSDGDDNNNGDYPGNNYDYETEDPNVDYSANARFTGKHGNNNEKNDVADNDGEDKDYAPKSPEEVDLEMPGDDYKIVLTSQKKGGNKPHVLNEDVNQSDDKVYLDDASNPADTDNTNYDENDPVSNDQNVNDGGNPVDSGNDENDPNKDVSSSVQKDPVYTDESNEEHPVHSGNDENDPNKDVSSSDQKHPVYTDESNEGHPVNSGNDENDPNKDVSSSDQKDPVYTDESNEEHPVNSGNDENEPNKDVSSSNQKDPVYTDESNEEHPVNSGNDENDPNKDVSSSDLKYPLYTDESNEGQGKELIPDYNKLVFPHHYDDDVSEENVQQEEFNSDCPRTCPARVMMVCARCKHGVYRTFLSICHMRMFACTKGQEREELQLVSREPCAVSAPHLGSPGEYPAGHVREPSDHDAILQFIHFYDQKLDKQEVMDDTNERAMALANGWGGKCCEDDEQLGDMDFQPVSLLFYYPDQQNVYHIFTRENLVNGRNVSIKLGDQEGLHASSFNPNRKTVVLIHGWTSSVECGFYASVVKAYLDAEDVNVVAVDWSEGSKTEYLKACNNVLKSGESVAKFINWVNKIKGSKPSQYHIVGFSLGGQQAGIASRKVDGKVAYITGLDPAEPNWVNHQDRLKKTDAAYVEVIHSNAGNLGMSEALGHVDFYMNGGAKQPGCPLVSGILTPSCHHARAYQYFAESLGSEGFIGRKCDSVKLANEERCFISTNFKMGGGQAKHGAQGIYHVKTNADPPFARLNY